MYLCKFKPFQRVLVRIGLEKWIPRLYFHFKNMNRISKDAYYLEVAKAVSQRSTCLRRQYGAVIVKNDEIIATGYNGAPRGFPNCCDIGICQKNLLELPHGDGYSHCKSVHAEMNAIISASRDKMINSIIYIYGSENGQDIVAEPCPICSRLISNAGILKIINKNSL